MEQEQDSLGRNRHANQNNGCKPAGKPGTGDGGVNIERPEWIDRPGNDYAAKAWQGVFDSLKDRDLLDTADAPLLEAFAEAWQTWANARDDVNVNGFTIICESDRGASITKKNPAVDVMSDAWKRARALFADLGVGASARAKLGTKEENQDPFEAFLAS